jgi:uncharacterized protein (UPF0212 family)
LKPTLERNRLEFVEVRRSLTSFPRCGRKINPLLRL